MKKTATAFVFAMLAGCAQPARHTPPAYSSAPVPAERLEPGQVVSLTSQQQNLIREGITKRLNDPESARFGKFGAARTKEGTIIVCGYVNAKNSFGGYTGMAPFMGGFLAPPNNNTFEVIRIGSRDTERQAIIEVCGQRGVPLSL